MAGDTEGTTPQGPIHKERSDDDDYEAHHILHLMKMSSFTTRKIIDNDLLDQGVM